MMLEEAGYTVIGAVNGNDALDKFISHEMKVDILVTDVITPKLDGKRLIEKIRESRPEYFGSKLAFSMYFNITGNSGTGCGSV